MKKEIVYAVVSESGDGVSIDGVYSTFLEANKQAQKLDSDHIKINGSMEYFSGYIVVQTKRIYK